MFELWVCLSFIYFLLSPFSIDYFCHLVIIVFILFTLTYFVISRPYYISIHVLWVFERYSFIFNFSLTIWKLEYMKQFNVHSATKVGMIMCCDMFLVTVHFLCILPLLSWQLHILYLLSLSTRSILAKICFANTQNIQQSGTISPFGYFDIDGVSSYDAKKKKVSSWQWWKWDGMLKVI